MKTLVWITTARGNSFEVSLPAKYKVCSKCEGTGTHVNPAVDGHGLNLSEMDPDFQESYFRGDYDVKCSECHGERVVLEVDVRALKPKTLAALFRAQDEAHAAQVEAAQERRRCGGF